jgi:undecaprenyl-diphosphatase
VTFFQAMVLALLQGFSELFPISSLGHTVLVPSLLHWDIDRKAPTFLAFIVALHLGTAIALLVFYWKDWEAIVRALFASIARGKLSRDPDERIAWLLIAGTIPVGLAGVLFQDTVRTFFGSTEIVAGFLILNAFVMFLGERLKRIERGPSSPPPRRLADLPWIDAVKVGLAQALALFPGISRSGSSIVAGLLLDLTHEDAARFSFLLATPVIGAAALLEIPELLAPSACRARAIARGRGVIGRHGVCVGRVPDKVL